MGLSKAVVQRRGRESIDTKEAEKDKKLALTDAVVVGGIAIVSLAGLILLAYFWITASSILVPFVVSAALPLFTLLAVIYQAIVYRRQWDAMKQALKQTDRVIEKMQAQLTASDRQAQAAEASLAQTRELVKHTEKGIEVAEENSRYAQRGYVTVTKREVSHKGFHLTIENTGNTPALSVAVTAITDADFTAPKMPEGSTLKGHTHIGLLPPRGSYQLVVPFDRPLTEAERDYFVNPEYDFNWWCRGTISYRDIFQQEEREYHETDFCFYRDRQGRAQAWVSHNDMRVHHIKYPPNYPEKMDNPN